MWKMKNYKKYWRSIEIEIWDSKSKRRRGMEEGFEWYKLKEFDDQDREIVYCLKKNWMKKLCVFLNDEFEEEMCGIYHANMKEWEKEDIFKRWKNEEFIYMIATSALGAGIDYKEMRLVIHQGHARSMINLCQETGRAGRDGKKADAITIFCEELLRETNWIEAKERENVLNC